MSSLPQGHPELLWRTLLDGRYEVQVRHNPLDRYKAMHMGTLNIYDLNQVISHPGYKGRLMHSRPIPLSREAANGIAEEDIALWMKIAQHFIHSLAKEKA